MQAEGGADGTELSEAAQPERRRKRQTEARRSCGTKKIPLVTSARFEKRNGRRREGEGATGSPWSEASRALVTVDSSMLELATVAAHNVFAQKFYGRANHHLSEVQK